MKRPIGRGTSRFVELIGKHATLSAPAKLNLRLKIEGRRSDGYHLLSMLNVGIELADLIQIEFLEEPTIAINVQGSADQELKDNPQQNLIYRAISRINQEFGCSLGAKVELTKAIPSGGGLGGGSSNAAALLRFIRNAVDPDQRDLVVGAQLAQIALELGADLPYFFAGGGLAFVSGIGEQIVKLTAAAVDQSDVLLLFPREKVATSEAYSWIRGSNLDRELFQDSLLRTTVSRMAKEELSFGELADLVENDFIPEVIKRTPTVREIFRRLGEMDQLTVSMSGSGSTCFVLGNGSGEIPQELESEVRDLLIDLDLEVVRSRLATQYEK